MTGTQTDLELSKGSLQFHQTLIVSDRFMPRQHPLNMHKRYAVSLTHIQMCMRNRAVT